MRNVFREYYRPNESEFEALWRDCIIAFDASVLLNLYNYSPPTAETFLTVLRALKQPLWLPYQAGLEYHRNRIGSIMKAAKEYEAAKSPLPDLLAKVKSRRQGPFLSEELMKHIERLAVDLANELDASHNRIKATKTDDPIRDQLTELFDGRVGTAFPPSTLGKLFDEGKDRYKTKTPPGYMDEKDKQGNDIYGDLVIWKEMIEKSRAEKKPFIFVTDDSKEDWWWIQDGVTVGPRVELLREFRAETNQAIHLYSSDSFLEYADRFLAKTIDKGALEEIREVRRAGPLAHLREGLRGSAGTGRSRNRAGEGEARFLRRGRGFRVLRLCDSVPRLRESTSEEVGQPLCFDLPANTLGRRPRETCFAGRLDSEVIGRMPKEPDLG